MPTSQVQYYSQPESTHQSVFSALNCFSKHQLSGGSAVKNLPAVQETWVQSLGQEDSLENGMATHSGILAWRFPWTGAWWATIYGVAQSQTRLKRRSSSSSNSDDKESACNPGDPGSIPGSGRSTGEGTGYPLLYFGLPLWLRQ